jgi:Zn-dependent M28 family amino/carboxypeptidase
MRSGVLRTAFLVAGLIAAAIVGALAMVTQPWVAVRASVQPAVDPARLQAHVKRLSVDFHPRSFDRVDNLDRTATYIAQAFRQAGGVVTPQEFSAGGRENRYRNVIARFGPASGPVMVIGAHYDSVDGTPGADDNASGVAGLIELARLLGNNPPGRAVQLVAFTLEEPPFYGSEKMGSRVHARSLKAEGQDVKLMISLEMIGTFTEEPDSQQFPLSGMDILYPDRGNFLAIIGRPDDMIATRKVKSLMAGASELVVHSMNAPASLSGVDFSDHRSYWAEGFSALMVTDTAFFRNRNYHMPEDTYDKLDYVRMAQVVRAVHAVAQGYE